MFEKDELIGGVYKKVTDWDAVAGAVIVCVIVLGIVGKCAG